MIRVRFAPSPTGYLHIGGARTALFNYMYAKSQGGQFILRIEDTDQERSKKEYVDEILDSLQWLGFKWDEEPYYQSQRFSIYTEYAKKLLDEGKAYKEETAVILKMSANPVNNGIGDTAPSADSSINEKADGGPQNIIKWNDLIRGEIRFDTETIKDQVLIKSDGSPTYSFACVVDDALMEISHVIRGEDHISNTPKQIIIYQALGFKIPKFAHLPLIMGSEGGRLSKRTGATAVTEYRNMGYLPEGIVNYLMLLGWSPGGNQEVVQFEDAIKKFSIKKINKTAAEFSLDKLDWINAQYIKKSDTAKLTGLLIPFFRQAGYKCDDFDRKHLENIVRLFQGRSSTLKDFLDWTKFIFEETLPQDPGVEKEITPDILDKFEKLAKVLEHIDPFVDKVVEEAFRGCVSKEGLQASALVHPVRVALTGKTVGPGLFETMVALGKEKTIKRLIEAKTTFKK